MNKAIILSLLFFSIHLPSIGQEKNNSSFLNNTIIEVAITYELFGGIGTIVKGKKKILNSKHFEGYLGLSLQFSHQSETNKFSDGVKGYNQDLGVYVVSDWIYYPFKSKKIFIGLEPFHGITNLRSKGTLKIQRYDISENYSNSYTYFNYGTTQKIGYNFGRVSTSLFAMISSKGLLDNGRTRFGDSDSKVFFGINFGYALK
ncbi:MAG: hypothetical protein L3J20_07375 [Flavobacteriaceae bacterium]|nr:hypothetical protein [Flavobacteriaceae bacterium]